MAAISSATFSHKCAGELAAGRFHRQFHAAAHPTEAGSTCVADPYIPALEYKTGVFDDFAILRHIAGQHTHARTHSIEQRERQPLLHLSYPQIPKIVLMDAEGRELPVQSFRLGARGLFCLADSSFQRLCECIQQVHRGEIWATTQQLNYLLDSVCQVPSLRVVSANGEKLLTSREEQVVALVADGLSNRNVATELGLSEHTVKKYLFRIFEKLGISNRVELVLYAVHHGSMQQTEWIAG
jgi:DNA-binding NarL/FixJ family response regulator